MDWIEANGASLRYDLSGSGSRDRRGCSTRSAAASRAGTKRLPALQRRFRVLRHDQRGFGMSEKTRAITMDGTVADLVALLDALGITGPVHLAGCAMGAAVALAFAGRYPTRVGRIVAASPATWANARPGSRHASASTRPSAAAYARSSQGAWRPRIRRRCAASIGARFERFRRRWLGERSRSHGRAILRMSTESRVRSERGSGADHGADPGDRLHTTGFARRRW